MNTLLHTVIAALIAAAKATWKHKVHTLRSAIFLASMVLVLDHHNLLEWLNVFLFRVLYTIANPYRPKETGTIKVLVFTIQEDLFETKFKSRSPIDRRELKRFLEELIKQFQEFREFKILAIDYD